MYTIGQKIEILNALEDSLQDCIRCKLHNSRTNLVFGAGNVEADLVFVGEGPGADEDKEGFPFVGAAGVMLTKMIRALGYEREQIYICNVVKCRPPGNRNPEPEEMAQCKQFLYAQLDMIQPKVVCALGAIAANMLTNRQDIISKMRGKVFRNRELVIVPTFHPAYIYRSYSKKKYVWEDLKLIESLLKEKEEKKIVDGTTLF
ncbi:MAG: uracil-DNA glycosylase [Anaerolineales bacterium]|nr:uracil-DNA glycosylase [Anaerolineales bacterium]